MSRAEDRLVGGRYQLVEPIGRGGMGVVWRAHDQLLDRAVAVKEVRYDSAMGDELSDLNRRTMREARAAGRLTHPNVVVVHDVIEEDDRPWIIMQLVPSRSLGQVIREDGPLSPERTVEIGLQILDALRAAHRQGVLHRDVKPENVLLTDDGRVVLTDFGIARLEADSTMTRTGLVGTPAFIAPERLRGEPAQRESDLWSLGATLYTAVEGKPPHDRGMAMATMHAVLNDDPAPPVRAGALGPVLLRMLAKEPVDRPGYEELIRLLKRAARELSPPPAKPEAPKPGTRGPASGAGRPSRGAAPYPPVSPALGDEPTDPGDAAGAAPAGDGAPKRGAAGAAAAAPGGASAVKAGRSGRDGEDAAGPGEITSPLPVVGDEEGPERKGGPASGKAEKAGKPGKAGKASVPMPETGVQAAPPARGTPSAGASTAGKPGEDGGAAAAKPEAEIGTRKVGSSAAFGLSSGPEDGKGAKGPAAPGTAKASGVSSGERPSTTPKTPSSAASGASAAAKGATGGRTGSKGAAPYASSGATGAAGGSRTDRAGDRAETSRPASGGSGPGTADERRAATAGRTPDSAGAAGIAGSPIAGLRQEPAAVPGHSQAAWHGMSTAPVAPRPGGGLLKVALILIPALLLVAGVAGYLGMQAGASGSGDDTATGAAPAASGKSGDKSSASAPPSDAPTSAEPSASASYEETKSPEPSPSPESIGPGDVPEGWRKFKHRSGFSLALPEGWHIDGRGNGEVRYRGDSHTYLEVHHTSSPESDALKVWRRDAPGMSRNFPGYKLVEIREVKGFWKTAADWEFTFGDSRFRSRVIDRGFVTSKKHGYALLFKTQDKDWKKKKKLFETIAATFKPAK